MAAKKPLAKKTVAKKSTAVKPAAKKATAPKTAAPKATAPKAAADKAAPPSGASASKLIDGRIAELGDWRGEALAQVRALIKAAAANVVEEWKWRGVPVWSHNGIICTGESYKNYIKLTFLKGGALDDPKGVFTTGFEGVRRAIDIHENDTLDAVAFKAIIRDAVALNAKKKK